MSRFHRAHVPLWTLFLATGIFALAYFQPVSATDSDGAIALLAAQALVEHGSLRLDAYRDDPRLAYDLTRDYRVRRFGDGLYYYNFGVPILSAPAVWLARRLGWDMLRQEQERALQELLSALACAAVFVLLTRVGMLLAAPVPVFVVALVTQLGSSLISTLATGLWSVGYAAALMLLALVLVIRHELGLEPRYRFLRWPLLAAILAAAYLCRPTAAFLVLGLAAYGLRRRRVPVRHAALAALAALAVGAATFALPGEWLRLLRYYTPVRMLGWQGSFTEGFAGHLISPSRGLLIWSPFLWVVLAAVLLRWRALAREPLFGLAVVWGSSHLLLASFKNMWWGGHSFGPRLLAEVMLPLYLITLLVVRQWSTRSRRRATSFPRPRLFAGSYLALGLVAIAVHSGQGLWNDAARRWNQEPDVDRHPELLFSWRHPQLLTSDERLRERGLAWQRARLEPWTTGETLLPGDPRAIFDGWWPAEGDWRWSTETARIYFQSREIDPTGWYLLALRAGALGEQRVTASLDHRPLGQRHFAGPGPRVERFVVDGAWLAGDGERELRLLVPGARTTPDDPRRLGLAFYSLALEPAPPPTDRIAHDHERFFLSGWSEAETGWRWSDGPRARLLLPAGTTGRVLELEAHGFGRQRVALRVGRRAICRLELSETVERRRCPLAPGILPAGRPLELAIELPDATASEHDPRRLGIAFYALRLLDEDPEQENQG